MITTEEAIRIQALLIEHFGGSAGIRDLQALESALNRPYASFDGVDLYPSLSEKAAALIESIVVNHPFIDGNKRLGYVLMRIVVQKANRDIVATEDEKYAFVIGIAKGERDTKLIKDWIEERLANQKDT